MDPARRTALAERRRLLDLRRRRTEQSAAFRRVAVPLCAAGVRFSKLVPSRNAALFGPLTAGPGQDEELDFACIADAQIVSWSTSAERDALCRRVLAAVAGEDESVALVWHPVIAGIRLRASALRAHITPLLDQGRGQTTWIASAAGGRWLVQVGFWSRTISYAINIPFSQA